MHFGLETQQQSTSTSACFGQVLLVQWGIVYIFKAKKNNCQQLNCIEVVQCWAEHCVGHALSLPEALFRLWVGGHQPSWH